jgi:hypothetical protein
VKTAYDEVKMNRLWWGIVSLEQDLRLGQNKSEASDERARELVARYREQLQEMCERFGANYADFVGDDRPLG